MRMDLDQEGLIELEAPPTERLDKAIPGARWSSGRGLWLLPLSWASCTVARSVLGDQLEVGEQLTAWSREEYESRVLPAAVAREAEDGPPWEPSEPGDPADTIERDVDVVEKASTAIDTPEKASEAWWADIWRGMPEFLNRDLSAQQQLIINFRSQEDVQEFARLIGQRIGPRQQPIWYPAADIVHEIDWRYADEEDPPTDVPFRPSHLRRFGLVEKEAKPKSARKRAAPKAAAPTEPKPDWAQVLLEAEG